MSVVYKAIQEPIGRVVALKVLKKGHAKDPANVKRFNREAKTLSSLKHINLLSIHDTGVTASGQPFFVMEYLQGITLDSLIEERGTIVIARAIPIFCQICDGMSYAHARGLIHRDLKPANIMLVTDDDGCEIVKLIDFGIVKQTDSSLISQRLTKKGEVWGSPVYMSPEQCTGAELDGRTDIYSLGLVMYEALVGVPAFKGGAPIGVIVSRQMTQMPADFKTAAPTLRIPEALEQIVFKAIQKKPDQRFASMEELRESLEQCARNHGIKPPKRTISRLYRMDTQDQPLPFLDGPARPRSGALPANCPMDDDTTSVQIDRAQNPAQAAADGKGAYSAADNPENALSAPVSPYVDPSKDNTRKIQSEREEHYTAPDVADRTRRVQSDTACNRSEPGPKKNAPDKDAIAATKKMNRNTATVQDNVGQPRLKTTRIDAAQKAARPSNAPPGPEPGAKRTLSSNQKIGIIAGAIFLLAFLILESAAVILYYQQNKSTPKEQGSGLTPSFSIDDTSGAKKKLSPGDSNAPPGSSAENGTIQQPEQQADSQNNSQESLQRTTELGEFTHKTATKTKHRVLKHKTAAPNASLDETALERIHLKKRHTDTTQQWLDIQKKVQFQ